LGWWNSQHMENKTCSKPSTRFIIVKKPSRTIQDSIDNSRMLHLSSRHQRFLRAPQICCWT
jgi:hypothetical protein